MRVGLPRRLGFRKAGNGRYPQRPIIEIVDDRAQGWPDEPRGRRTHEACNAPLSEIGLAGLQMRKRIDESDFVRRKAGARNAVQLNFVGGAAREHIDDDGAGAPVVRKPASAEEVVGTIRRLL